MEASKTDDGSVSPSSESARFIAGLESGDLATLRRVPKADLHVHAYLGGCRAHIRARTGQDIPPLQGVLGSMDEMHAWNEAYVGPVFKAPGRRALPFEATFVQCVRDGVARIDMGLDVAVVAREWATPADAWTWLKGIHQREAPAVDWLPQLGASRGSRPEKVEAWAEPLLEIGRAACRERL